MHKPPVHLGMPTLIEYPSLTQNLELCAELGLDFIELNMNLPEYQPDAANRAEINRLFQEYGKYPTIHLDEKLSVCEFNTAVAEAYVDTVIRTIALAEKINAPVLNMHMNGGTYFTLPDKKVYLFERYKERYLERLRRFGDACAEAIGGCDILICIENCGAFQDFQREGIDMLLENPCFALTYDIGHDQSAGRANEAFIINRADRLKHMHIHDAADNKDHLTLGTGAIDIKAKLALAREHGCRCVIETKTEAALRESVRYIKRLK